MCHTQQQHSHYVYAVRFAHITRHSESNCQTLFNNPRSLWEYDEIANEAKK